MCQALLWTLGTYHQQRYPCSPHEAYFKVQARKRHANIQDQVVIRACIVSLNVVHSFHSY